MPGIPQNGRLHLLFHARKSKKWAASPSVLGGSGYEIKGVVDNLGGFQAWVPERSDFFKGPKGPKGPLGPERSDFFKGASPRPPWQWAVLHVVDARRSSKGKSMEHDCDVEKLKSNVVAKAIVDTKESLVK